MVCSIIIATPGLAAAESLSLSLGAKPTINEPLSITAEGMADGVHRLYVYVEAGGEICASDPYQETSERFGEIALSSEEGDPLGAGNFRKVYTYTPEANNVYGVCAYLDYASSDPPDAISESSFPIPSDLVEAPYLHNPQLQEELKHIAVEDEQRERAQVKEREERELRERRPGASGGYYTPNPELQARETEERKTPEAGNVRCIVPSLKGHSLAGARIVLRKAHCRLGRIRRPRKHDGALVVTAQSPARGTKLPQGAAVSVTLRPQRR